MPVGRSYLMWYGNKAYDFNLTINNIIKTCDLYLVINKPINAILNYLFYVHYFKNYVTRHSKASASTDRLTHSSWYHSTQVSHSFFLQIRVKHIILKEKSTAGT